MELYSYLVITLLVTLIALVAWGRVERHWIGLAILLTLVLSGALTPSEVVEFIDWDVLGLILGMNIFTVFLEESGLMDLVSRFMIRRIDSPRVAVFWISFLAGLVSIFLENVTVVLLLAPIAFRIALHLGIDPALILIPTALASNMAGSATMVGDPPAIITAGYLNLAFMDFIWYRGKPSMFFMTLIPMVLACLVAAFIAEKSAEHIHGQKHGWSSNTSELSRDVDRLFLLEATAFLSLKIALLSLRHELRIPLSLAALAGVGGVTLSRLAHRDRDSVVRAFREGFEWRLLLFLAGIFTLSGAFAKYGLATAVAKNIVELAGGSLLIVTSMLVWISVAMSAFIDNVPYTVTMLPVITAIARSLGVEPIVIAWAVLLGTTLGGNLTYIGASANVMAIRLLEKRGRDVSFTQFIRVSVPFNTISVVTGWVMYELLWVLPNT